MFRLFKHNIYIVIQREHNSKKGQMQNLTVRIAEIPAIKFKCQAQKEAYVKVIKKNRIIRIFFKTKEAETL